MSTPVRDVATRHGGLRAARPRPGSGPRRVLASLAVLATLTTAGCTDAPVTTDTPAPAPTAIDSQPVPGASDADDRAPSVQEIRLSEPLDHVHGLVTTGQGTLLAGTHSGVVAITTDGAVTRVGDSRDDLMGMTGVPGTTMLASSGHPGAGSALPNPLGLILSDDGGLTWSAASLTGEVDFHALATDGTLVVGFDGRAGLLISTDAGATFTPGATIAPAALAVTPGHVWATTADGVQHSTDNGLTFDVITGAPLLVLLAAGPDHSLWGVDTDGVAWRSSDGASWEQRGTVGRIQALAVADHATAYAATATTLLVLG